MLLRDATQNRNAGRDVNERELPGHQWPSNIAVDQRWGMT
jgi:hypothetical protein